MVFIAIAALTKTVVPPYFLRHGLKNQEFTNALDWLVSELSDLPVAASPVLL